MHSPLNLPSLPQPHAFPPLLFTSFPFLSFSLPHSLLLPSVSLSFLLPLLIPSSSLQPPEVCYFHPPSLSPPPFPFGLPPCPCQPSWPYRHCSKAWKTRPSSALCPPSSSRPFLCKRQEEMKTDQSKKINLLFLLLLLLSEKYPQIPFLDNTARALLMTFVARGDCGFWPAHFLLSNTLVVFRV